MIQAPCLRERDVQKERHTYRMSEMQKEQKHKDRQTERGQTDRDMQKERNTERNIRKKKQIQINTETVMYRRKGMQKEFSIERDVHKKTH